jgi:hypothetical protein
MSRDEMIKFAQFIRDKGENLKLDAVMGGEYSDGGGGRIIAEADAFLAGLAGHLPPEWIKRYMKEYIKVNDPEYSTFLRLKKKFA